MSSLDMDGTEPSADQRFAAIDAALEQGDAETARLLTAPLLRDDASGEETLLQGGVLLRLAYCDLAKSQVRRAHSWAGKAARAFRECAAQTDEVEALSLWARMASVLGRNVEAVKTASLATKLANELPAGISTARAYAALGLAYGCGRAFTEAEEAFEMATQLICRHGGAKAQLEVTITRSWIEVLRYCNDGRASKPSKRFAELQRLMELQQLPTQEGTRSLTPGAAAHLQASKSLVCGLMALWSGKPEEARSFMAQCMQTGPSPVAWILSAQSWLAAELAVTESDLEAASMHATRMSALASEVEHLPFKCLGHELACNIFGRQGNPELAFEEQRLLLRCEREMRGRDLDCCDEVARLHLTARHGVAELQELADKSRHLEKLAYEDPLTGIANRRRFDECLTEWWAATEAGEKPLCVALIDADQFKGINDNFSHDVGDQALQGIAAAMVANIRSTDLAARWGGDEFAILFRDTDMQTAEQVAFRIQRAVRERDWSSVAEGLSVNISVGVTEAHSGDTWASIIERSDSLMSAQKAAHQTEQAQQAISPLVLRTVGTWLRQAERVVVFVGAEDAVRRNAPPHSGSLATWPASERNCFGHARGAQSNPHEFASFWQKWRKSMGGREASQSHIALVKLTHRLAQVQFVTERFDGSLSTAGAENVIELHGNAFRNRCADCARTSVHAGQENCLFCGGVIRPDIVLLGETVNSRIRSNAEFAMRRANLILAVDCDGKTYHSSSLLEEARSRGARVVALGSCRQTLLNDVDVTIAAPIEVVAEALSQTLDGAPTEVETRAELTEDGFSILCFYSGQASDNFGVALECALEWKDWEIATHLWTIPWMFPLTTQSSMNPEAPTPSPQDFQTLACEGCVRAGMRQAFLMMLRFYGFVWRDGRVTKADSWRNGFAVWAVVRSHHDMLISRILRSLTLIGLKEEALQFLIALDVEVKQYRGEDAYQALWHWRSAVYGRWLL